MRELFNPKYQRALQKDPTLGTPLFEQDGARAVPPPTVKTSDTRNTAFREVIESGKVRGMQLRILGLIKSQGPLTSRQISDFTGIERTSVTARLTELRDDLGLIEEGHKVINPKSNKPNTTYRIKSNA